MRPKILSKITLVVTIVIVSFFVFPASSPVFAQVDTIDEIKEQLRRPQPRIKIPGVKFTPIDEIEVEETGSGNLYINIPFLGEYIAAVYRYLIVAITVLSVVTIIIGGIRWMVPAGQENIKHAQKEIMGAIIGLLIALGSYVLLYAINPNLVEFKSLRILYISSNEFDSSAAKGTELSDSKERCGGKAGNKQTLFPGLDGSLHKKASYSTKYGPTCKTKVEPKAIILHWTAGTKNADYVVRAWSHSESKGNICQIIIDTDGKAYQITDSLEEKVICQGGSTGQNWNNGGIGIEIVGNSEKMLLSNETQKQAVITVVNNLISKYNIPKTNQVGDLLNGKGGIFTHRQITRCQANSNKEDAGENYAKEIIKAIGGNYYEYKNHPKCN